MSYFIVYFNLFTIGGDNVKDGITMDFPMSSGQRALWFLQHLAPESAAYNIHFVGRLTQALDISALKWAFEQLVNRHPLLRAVYVLQGDQPVQRIRQSLDGYFVHVDASGWSEE